MRKILSAAWIAALILISCSTGQGTIGNNENAPFLVVKPETEKAASTQPYVDDGLDWTWDLIAGQHMLAGTVHVYNDEDSIYIEYHTFDDWPMYSAHAYCGTTQPVKGAPGQFPAGIEFDDPVHDWSFSFPLAEIGYKGQLYLAAHADVGEGGGNETSWGGYWNDGDPYWDFDWKKWGGGFTSWIMPMPGLPEGAVSYRGYHYGSYSYWDVAFADSFPLPPGSIVVNGQTRWVGWCCDKDHTMYANSPYEVTLYSSYDPDLPPMAQGIAWDMLNYMLNQRRNGTGIWDRDWHANGNKDQFQHALWYFTEGIVPAAGSLAESFVNDALANGDGFIPGPGEFYALILYPDTSTTKQYVRAQMNIIELDP
ncbi:hypothetical protein KDL29_10820 [bacterium]|nr:hypothetical protein [bacterium]